MSRDPSGIWLKRSPSSPDFERGDNDPSQPEPPYVATRSDQGHRDYPAIDLESAIDDEKLPLSEPRTSETKPTAQYTSEHANGPSFKDQTRSYIAVKVEEATPCVQLPDYKDQVRPHAASLKSSKRVTPGAVAMHMDVHTRGASPKETTGPFYKDQVRPHALENESAKKIHKAGVNDHQARLEALANLPQRQNVPPDESVPTLEPGLIQAHVVDDENDPRTLVQAEAMPGGLFLNRRVAFGVVLLLVVAGIVAGGVCGGTDVCHRATPPVPTMAPTTLPPTAPPTPEPTLSSNSLEIVQYIESIRLGSEPIVLPILGNRNATPAELALDWILNEDPLNLTLDNEDEKARLRQRYGLLTFFYSTNGPSWTINDNWLTEKDECTWYGITCTDAGVVQTVGSEGVLSPENALSSNSLSGTIPDDMALLSSVNEMNLYSNPGLGGSIPASFGTMRNLQYIRFDNCGFSGRLSESMGDLSNLVSVRVSFF